MARDALAFGPFRLDLRAHRLFRGDVPVPLSAHLVDLLALFASRAGDLLTKDAIFAAAWPDVFVTDNTLARAVADLRRALGDDPAAPRYIQTVARRGYRFVAPVTALDDRPATPAPDPAGAFDELRQFVTSVTDLERLRVDGLDAVIRRLERAAVVLPDYAPVHVALASAWTLAAESRRVSTTPDRTFVDRAIAAAERARALDPALGEAWATLAFALTSAGRWDEARAAARQAVRLEPDSWRHHFRLALAAWGEERLRAAHRALALLPGFPFACFLGATVLVARGLLERAGELAAQGLAGSDHATTGERLPASGLHWLTGAVDAAMGRHDEALSHFAREIDAHDAGRLYSTEFVVNAHHWRAGLHARHGRGDLAIADLRAALALHPAHPRSLAALGALLVDRGAEAEGRDLLRRAAAAVSALAESGRHAEAALCEATRASIAHEPALAVELLSRMLDQPTAEHAGWTLPIEPWLMSLHDQPGFEALLRRVAQRAL